MASLVRLLRDLKPNRRPLLLLEGVNTGLKIGQVRVLIRILGGRGREHFRQVDLPILLVRTEDEMLVVQLARLEVTVDNRLQHVLNFLSQVACNLLFAQ